MDLLAAHTFCERKKSILLDLQRSMFRVAKETGAAEDFKTKTLGSANYLFFSITASLLGIVEKVVTRLELKLQRSSNHRLARKNRTVFKSK